MTADHLGVGRDRSSSKELGNQPPNTFEARNASTADARDPDKEIRNIHEDRLDDGSSGSVKEVFDIQAVDPALAKKMAIVNEAIDAIGMTSFQWKMSFLNGFGYAVDSVSEFTPLLAEELVLTLRLPYAPASDCLSIDYKPCYTARVWVT